MIGMDFGAFFTLCVISLIGAVVVHYGFHYRFLGGIDGFLAKWVVGWLGAWLAAPVIGYWFHGLSINGQYLLPAFLGRTSALFGTPYLSILVTTGLMILGITVLPIELLVKAASTMLLVRSRTIARSCSWIRTTRALATPWKGC